MIITASPDYALPRRAKRKRQFAFWCGWSAWLLLRDKIKHSRKILSQMSQPVFRYYFSDEGIRFESELGSSLSSWKMFQRLSRYPDLWLLFTDEANYVVLPLTQMTPDAQQLLERKCREHKIPVT